MASVQEGAVIWNSLILPSAACQPTPEFLLRIAIFQGGFLWRRLPGLPSDDRLRKLKITASSIRRGDANKPIAPPSPSWDAVPEPENRTVMNSKRNRRLMMALLFVGGPLVGYLLNGDRGLLLGLGTSVLAILWYLLDERHLF
jgi:hypothetical protein